MSFFSISVFLFPYLRAIGLTSCFVDSDFFGGVLGEDSDETYAALSGAEWAATSGGRPCFYTPTGDCRDAPLGGLDPAAGLLTEAAAAARLPSATGASDRAGDFFTPEAAATVTEVYREDLSLLGYPIWSGEGPIPYA